MMGKPPFFSLFKKIVRSDAPLSGGRHLWDSFMGLVFKAEVHWDFRRERFPYTYRGLTATE